MLRLTLREGIWKRIEVVIPPIPLAIMILDLQLFTYQLGIIGHPFLSRRPELGAFVSRAKLFQSANEHQILRKAKHALQIAPKALHQRTVYHPLPAFQKNSRHHLPDYVREQFILKKKCLNKMSWRP